jgi:hypothetical protein
MFGVIRQRISALLRERDDDPSADEGPSVEI